MNSFQNLSKRIRKRIQNSVKRLFTSKSSTFEDTKSAINLVVTGDLVSEMRQSSYDNIKMIYPNTKMQSVDSSRNESDQTLRYFLKPDKKSVPAQSGEEISVVDFGQSDVLKIESSKSSGIKSTNITKSASKSKSDRSLYTCPTGRHSTVKSDEPCICINIEQLLYHQNAQIVYEWHKFKSEPTSLDSFKLEYPNKCIQGGQGVVFWVYDIKNNRHFALKMKLRDTKSNSSWLIERRESKMLKKIQHNFIVNLYHVHETPGAMFMTMEYLDGGCLWSHVAKKGTLPESYTIYYSACILNALHHLHQKNIVYRDLKAENIVLDTHGRPKLIDFGMAKKIAFSNTFSIYKSIDEESEHYPATQYYYAAYLAPEIYSKPSSANAFIDSWGLGYVVSEVLLGYGVFLPMPWEKIDCHIKENWRYQYEGDISISGSCKSFLESMLRYNPTSRMSLDEAIVHPFFRRVNWSTLVYVKPPDLSIFLRRTKGSKIIQAVPSEKYNLPSSFEFCDFQLPDPILTPGSNNQCSSYFADVASPKDTPINPNAPSIRLPILVVKESGNFLKHNRISNNLKYDIYRALRVQNQQQNRIAIDTLSNLRPIKKV